MEKTYKVDRSGVLKVLAGRGVGLVKCERKDWKGRKMRGNTHKKDKRM